MSHDRDTRVGPGTPERVKIAYCDGPRLRRFLVAATEYVSAHRRELNRINVFPVPDGDTGTNLVHTLRAASDAVRPLEEPSVSAVARAAAEGSLMGARGNSGMILSRFLLGFSEGLEGRARAGTRALADALHAAAASLSEAMERPVEGTILTVVRETAEEARKSAAARDDVYRWLHDVKAAARRSLARTRETLPVLREAGVVDAGAKGFVDMLEGAVRYIEDGTHPEAEAAEPDGAGAPSSGTPSPDASSAGGPADGGGEGRYCTQIAVQGDRIPDTQALRAAVEDLGTSLIVVRTASLAKVHIHADDPEAVEERLREFAPVASRRVEDTRERTGSRRVAVVTDSSADLPAEWVREKGVEVVPQQLIVDGASYRDGVDMTPAELMERMADPGSAPPTTSQPSPASFVDVYRRAYERGVEELLGIFLSGALSGTRDAAAAAARSLEGREGTWEIVDSRTTSLGLGLQVIRAVELLEEGMTIPEVVRRVRRVRERSGIFFTVESLEGLFRSGRVGRARAWLGDMLDLRPVLTVDDEGRVVPHGRARKREGVVELMLETLEEGLRDARRYRVGIMHAGEPELAARLEREVLTRLDPAETYVNSLTAVIVAHVGPGAWGVCYQIEDED